MLINLVDVVVVNVIVFVIVVVVVVTVVIVFVVIIVVVLIVVVAVFVVTIRRERAKRALGCVRGSNERLRRRRNRERILRRVFGRRIRKTTSSCPEFRAKILVG